MALSLPTCVNKIHKWKAELTNLKNCLGVISKTVPCGYECFFGLVHQCKVHDSNLEKVYSLVAVSHEGCWRFLPVIWCESGTCAILKRNFELHPPHEESIWYPAYSAGSGHLQTCAEFKASAYKVLSLIFCLFLLNIYSHKRWAFLDYNRKLIYFSPLGTL